MQCRDLDMLTTSHVGNSSSVFIFYLILWLRWTLGKVCLRQPYITCVESKIIRPYMLSMCECSIVCNTTDLPLHKAKSFSLTLPLLRAKVSQCDSHPIVSSWLPINMIHMFWRHPKSRGVVSRHNSLGHTIEVGPHVVHNIGASQTSIHPCSIEDWPSHAHVTSFTDIVSILLSYKFYLFKAYLPRKRIG